MTVRRLFSTVGLLILSPFLMAFQGELPAAAPGDIPWLVWLLLLLVAAGLLWLAWSRRDVDAFDTGHHDEDGHGSHGHDDHAHDEHTTSELTVRIIPIPLLQARWGRRFTPMTQRK